MTAMESYMRMHSFPIVSMSHSFYNLVIHEPGSQNIVISDDMLDDDIEHRIERETQLTGFFKVCSREDWIGEIARKLTYEELPYYFTFVLFCIIFVILNFRWKSTKKEWTLRDVQPQSIDYSTTDMFVRMYTVSPSRGELYAIRALLQVLRGLKKFNYLKRIPIFTTAEEFECVNQNCMCCKKCLYAMPISELKEVIFLYIFLILNYKH